MAASVRLLCDDCSNDWVLESIEDYKDHINQHSEAPDRGEFVVQFMNSERTWVWYRWLGDSADLLSS